MAIVASGTVGAQAITMAFVPVITRLYGPEAFGLLGTFLAVLAVLVPIAALTYPIAIVLAKSDQDAITIAKFSVFFVFLVAAIATLALLVAGDRIAQEFNLESISKYFLLLPVAMICAAFHQILTQWLIRKKQFRLTAKAAVIQAIIINSAKVGVGSFHPVGAVLIVIATLGQLIHALLLWVGIRHVATAQPNNEDEPTGTALELAKRHRDFPLYRAPQALLNAASDSLPIIFIAAYFGVASAGYLALTRSVLSAPVALVGTAVGNVFYPKAVELYDNRVELKKFLVRSTLGLVFLGLIAFFPIFFWGPSIFSLIFGKDWVVAGQFAKWVAVWMAFSLAARPVISIIPVVRLQGQFLTFECVFLPLKVGALYAGMLAGSAAISVALFSLVGAFFYVCLYFLVSRKT